MTLAERTHSHRLLEEQCEVHYACSGFWDQDGMRHLLGLLSEAVIPLIKAGKPIYAMGDFTGYVPQDRETADLIGRHLAASQQAGLRRSAVVGASPLVKMQYKRISQGIDVEYFDTKNDALDWLRADR